MENSHYKSAFFISLLYALLGGLWIFFSDRLLLFSVPEPTHPFQRQTYQEYF